MCAHTQPYGFSCGLCACIRKQSIFMESCFSSSSKCAFIYRAIFWFRLQCQQHWWQISEKEICIFIWVNLLKWGCLVMMLVLIFKLAIVFIYFPPPLFITKYIYKFLHFCNGHWSTVFFLTGEVTGCLVI